MVVVKNQQPTVKTDPVLNLKMNQLEDQLKKINEYLMNNNSKNPKIIRNVLNLPKEVKIINNYDENNESTVKVKKVENVENVENVEYEEVEVTDDENDSEED